MHREIKDPGKMKNWKSLFILAAAIFIAVFFRLYKLEFFYSFEHDQDLYSWIVKDILIDHHFRLIGQMTSIQGFFIGPLYYYLLAPFYFFSGMNPLSATLLAPLISVLTLLSIFWVFTKIFNQKVGIIGAFIYSSSLSIVFIDRWTVPTQLTMLWSVWFFYCLMKLAARDYKVLSLLGILIGLIWHIHIALLPLIILIPPAIVVSSKRPKLKPQILFFIMFFLTTSPFWIFEFRHDFQEINSLLNFYNSSVPGEKTGFLRFREVLDGASSAFSKIIFYKKDISSILTLSAFYFTCTILVLLKKIKPNQIIIIVLWTFLVIISQEVSNKGLSDYYFNNLIILGILIISLLVFLLFSNRNLKILAFLIMAIFAIYNLRIFLNTPSITSYYEKKEVIQFIKKDSDSKEFPCLAVNFVADFTKNAGFRYLYWYWGLNVVRPTEKVPIYNVAIPSSLFEKSDFKVGDFAVVLPENKQYSKEVCQDPGNKLPELLGFTN